MAICAGALARRDPGGRLRGPNRSCLAGRRHQTIDTLLISSVSLAILLVGVLALIPLGLRNGDGPRDVRVLAIDAVGGRRGASVTLTNPDRVPVIVGMSLRPAGLRLRLEGDAYVRIRTRSTAPDVLPRRQTAIAVLSPGATATFLVAADADVPQRAELVVRIGQRQRLRVIHRLVQLPPPDSAIDRQDLSLARR